MDKKIILSITGNQRSFEGEDSKIELITEGRLYKKDNVYYIEYEESEISGMEGTKTLIKIDGNTVALERSGTHVSHFIFEEGKKYINYYSTPFGNLEMGIYSIEVDSNVNDKEGKLDLKYQLDIGGKYISSNELCVVYRESKKDTCSRCNN